MGVPGVPLHTQILAEQLTLFQPGGTDYAHLITTGTPGFSDLPTALYYIIPIVYCISTIEPSNVNQHPKYLCALVLLTIDESENLAFVFRENIWWAGHCPRVVHTANLSYDMQ